MPLYLYDINSYGDKEGSFGYRARNGELLEYYLCVILFFVFNIFFRDAGYFLVSDSA